MTKEQAHRALLAIADAIIEAVRSVEPDGAPGGVIYLACMEFGATLDQFQQLMDALVEVGKLRQEGHFYFAA